MGKGGKSDNDGEYTPPRKDNKKKADKIPKDGSINKNKTQKTIKSTQSSAVSS